MLLTKQLPAQEEVVVFDGIVHALGHVTLRAVQEHIQHLLHSVMLVRIDRRLGRVAAISKANAMHAIRVPRAKPGAEPEEEVPFDLLEAQLLHIVMVAELGVSRSEVVVRNRRVLGSLLLL